MKCNVNITQLMKRFQAYFLFFIPNIKTCVLLYVLAITLLLRDSLSAVISTQWGEELTTIYNSLSANDFLNWMTVILLLVLVWTMSRRILQDKYYSWRALVCGFVVLYLFLDDNWIWVKVLFFDYKWLLILAFFVLGMCEFINLGKLLARTPKTINQVNKGFSVTPDSNLTRAEEWGGYIKSLIAKLLGTDVGRESFALGVTGVWGSGKTTFLMSLKEELQKYVYLVDFNPWNCDSASQISDDFFSTLVSSLTIPSYQKRLIVKYSKLLGQFDALKVQTNLAASFFNDDTSIAQAKEKAADVIGNMPFRVVVVIDDLDRLDEKELMEVLRLIRTTANFKNLLYVVAYDKRYITHVLGEIKGGEFLKKIFPLEVCLPALDNDASLNFLSNELEKCIDDNEVFNLIKSSCFNELNRQWVALYLPTFRDIKRFVSQFCLNINAFIRSKTISEINAVDFFYLELLQYYDFNAYQFIRDDSISMSLLEYGFDNHKYVLKYIDYDTVKGEKFIGEKNKRTEILGKYKQGVDYILKMLFSERNADLQNSIRYPANFQKYFSYRINEDIISIEEYKKFISKTINKDLKDNVKEYCKGSVSKTNSLMFHLLSHELGTADEQHVHNVAFSLIELARYKNFNVVAVFKTLFEKNGYQCFDNISKALEKAIRAQIEGDKCKYRVIQNILTSLVKETCGDDDFLEVKYESVLTNETLKTLAARNFQIILDQIDEPLPIQLITDKASRLHKFLSTAVATVSTYSYDGEHYEHIKLSLVIETLKEYYSSRDNKSGLELFFRQLDPSKGDPYFYDVQDPIYREMVNDNIEGVFGNISAFNDFISHVFKDINKVNTELRMLGLKPLSENI